VEDIPSEVVLRNPKDPRAYIPDDAAFAVYGENEREESMVTSRILSWPDGNAVR
jgi:hypothetical protein